jgi:hypothetical protein
VISIESAEETPDFQHWKPSKTGLHYYQWYLIFVANQSPSFLDEIIFYYQ